MSLNRTNDYLFKFIFGKNERKEALLDFVNAVLTDGGEENVIVDIELLDRELDPEHCKDKASRLDIRAKTRSGTLINIEVQTTDESDIDKRSLFYWGKLYCGQMSQGMHYEDLKPAIVINVLTFNYFEEDEYHNIFQISNRKSHRLLNDDLQMHFLELKKWSDLSRKARNRLERWLLFISDNNPEELEEVAMLNPAINSAMEAERLFSASEENRYIYDLREKGRMDFLSAVGTAQRKGEAKGMEKGKEEEKARFIRNMFEEGMSAQAISRIAKLSVEDVLKYKN